MHRNSCSVSGIYMYNVQSLFADDFIGNAETGSALQSLIDIVHNYSYCWQFEANVN